MYTEETDLLEEGSELLFVELSRLPFCWLVDGNFGEKVNGCRVRTVMRHSP